MTAFRFSPGCCCSSSPCVPCSDQNAGPNTPMMSDFAAIEAEVLSQQGGDCQFGRFVYFVMHRANLAEGGYISFVKHYALAQRYVTYFSGGRTAAYNGQIAGNAEATRANDLYSFPPYGSAYAGDTKRFYIWRRCGDVVDGEHYGYSEYYRYNVPQDEILIIPGVQQDAFISRVELKNGNSATYTRSASSQSSARTLIRTNLSIGQLASVTWSYPATATPVYRYNGDRSLLTASRPVEGMPGSLVDYEWYVVPRQQEYTASDAVDVDRDTGWAEIRGAAGSYVETNTIQVESGTTESDLLQPDYTMTWDNTDFYLDKNVDIYWTGLHG